MKTTRYRVYEAPDGSDDAYCGEYDTLEEAQAAAEAEPAGLPRSMWDSAYACGSHMGGLYPPPRDGVEDVEPRSWHGDSGWHCVVGVEYDTTEERVEP